MEEAGHTAALTSTSTTLSRSAASDSSESESDVGDGFPSDSRAALPKIRGLWGATIVKFSSFSRSWFDGSLM